MSGPPYRFCFVPLKTYLLRFITLNLARGILGEFRIAQNNCTYMLVRDKLGVYFLFNPADNFRFDFIICKRQAHQFRISRERFLIRKNLRRNLGSYGSRDLAWRRSNPG